MNYFCSKLCSGDLFFKILIIFNFSQFDVYDLPNFSGSFDNCQVAPCNLTCVNTDGVRKKPAKYRQAKYRQSIISSCNNITKQNIVDIFIRSLLTLTPLIHILVLWTLLSWKYEYVRVFEYVQQINNNSNWQVITVGLYTSIFHTYIRTSM